MVRLGNETRRKVRCASAPRHLELRRSPIWQTKSQDPKTKAILVNSPHNPTGTAFSLPDLEAIAALCKQHDVIAICDEVYEHLIYEGAYQAAHAQACATV